MKGDTGATGATGPAAAKYAKKLTTDNNGQITAVWTNGLFTTPVLNCEIQANDTYTYSCVILSTSATGCVIQVKRAAASVALTGLLNLSLFHGGSERNHRSRIGIGGYVNQSR